VPQLVALGGVSLLALVVGMFAPANWINMRLSARDVGGMIMERDTSADAMRDMAAVDPRRVVASYSLETRGVLLAKQLIHETHLPMTEVAFAAGFSSVRRFNETFLALFGRAPGNLRRASSHEVSTGRHGEIGLLHALRATVRFPKLSALRPSLRGCGACSTWWPIP
jgi:Helix-turn-helix domain